MRSNVCKIENGTKDLGAILRESEKVAVYNELDAKQTMQLRLLCEELDGMLPALIGDFGGSLWIDFEDGVCKVYASIEIAQISAERKKSLIDIAKNKKNAAATGLVGKIRTALENYALDTQYTDVMSAASGAYGVAMEYDIGLNYSYCWSLGQHKRAVMTDNKKEDWDELEKSLIASVADDVIVGVRGRQADVIIVKKFA